MKKLLFLVPLLSLVCPALAEERNNFCFTHEYEYDAYITSKTYDHHQFDATVPYLANPTDELDRQGFRNTSYEKFDYFLSTTPHDKAVLSPGNTMIGMFIEDQERQGGITPLNLVMWDSSSGTVEPDDDPNNIQFYRLSPNQGTYNQAGSIYDLSTAAAQEGISGLFEVIDGSGNFKTVAHLMAEFHYHTGTTDDGETMVGEAELLDSSGTKVTGTSTLTFINDNGDENSGGSGRAGFSWYDEPDGYKVRLTIDQDGTEEKSVDIVLGDHTRVFDLDGDGNSTTDAADDSREVIDRMVTGGPWQAADLKYNHDGLIDEIGVIGDCTKQYFDFEIGQTDVFTMLQNYGSGYDKGDFDFDGDVDATDESIMDGNYTGPAQAWSTYGKYYDEGDLDLDGDIDTADQTIFDNL